jgi:hypothetical protein
MYLYLLACPDVWQFLAKKLAKVSFVHVECIQRVNLANLSSEGLPWLYVYLSGPVLGH